MRHLFTWLLSALLFSGPLAASEGPVERLLARPEAPAGVVFEIVSGDDDLLTVLLPQLKRDIGRLRARFPDLPIAVVTHGSEQFALLARERERQAETHALVEELVRSEQVDVHVCGTHAAWEGHVPEDFPDYVDVSPAGPAQINDYLNLGYERILLP